jgi:hypothetical protein
MVLSIVCMTVPTDQFTQLAHRGQEAFSAAVRAWQNTLRSYPGAAPSTEALSDVDAIVDAAFDVAARVLDGQREFTKALVSIATQSFKAITEQATQVADQAARAADIHKADAPVRLAEPRDQAAGRTEPASGSTRAAPAAAPKRPRNGRRTDDA